jgi:dihydrofolate synthase/folylpolyglutamate synthase
MALSDAILTRLLTLHPKIIDLGLDRMERILAKLGNPERHLPPVIHIAGTNGKGSTLATLRAILEAAGLTVHCYTSPHLVKFHERIRLAGELIAEDRLSALLEECEEANGGEPITFFEITTAAAFLAFSRTPADYVILETGLGGRLDATNVVARPAVTIITAIDYDHQQFLGDTLTAIAHEKAGILKRGVACVVAQGPDEALAEITRVAGRKKVKLFVAGEDWHVFEQHGRLVYHDDQGLLDLPLPQLKGPHQIDNAGNAIAALRLLSDSRIADQAFGDGIKAVEWPARMQRLGTGPLRALLPGDAELWLDGGHNPSAGQVLARALSDMNERHSRPLVLVWGMLNTKDAGSFIAPFGGLAGKVIAVTIPDEPNAIPAADLAAIAARHGLAAEAAPDLETAIARAGGTSPSPRVLICGSLYLAGHVLARQTGEAMSAVSGVARR